MVLPLTTRCRVLTARVLVAHLAATVPMLAEDQRLESLIDQHIDAALAEGKIHCSEMATDSEFLRRVTFDLTGTIPNFDVDLSPDNRQLAVADHDGTVRFYEMATEETDKETAKT